MTFHQILSIVSLWILPIIILTILTVGIIRKIPVYEVFVEGAKSGFKVSINIIPYLVALIVAISMLRASGMIDCLGYYCGSFLNFIGVPIDVLPIMIVRSLSGSAALGVFADMAHHCNVDSYALKLGAVMLGSSETTFYVLAVYFGSVGIAKLRYAVLTGIIADIIGIVSAIIVCRYFFG